MAVKVDFKKALSEAQRDVLNIEKAVVAQLRRRAEKFVTEARLAVNIDSGAFPKGDFTDRTKNLRNSIGYVIYKNGVAVKENFEGSGEGVSTARYELAKIPSKPGYVLVIIAGMNYASYLESLGYNVITSQSMVMISDLAKDMERLEKKTGAQLATEVQGVSSRL